MTDEIRRLLGGYASGTLTEEEREQLYNAALEDPAVFEAMAEEQPLRDVLDDPSARAELLAAVQDRPFSMTAALRDWFERPKSKVLAALGVVALVAIGVKQWTEMREVPAGTREIAQLTPAPAREAPFREPESLPRTKQIPARRGAAAPEPETLPATPSESTASTPSPAPAAPAATTAAPSATTPATTASAPRVVGAAPPVTAGAARTAPLAATADRPSSATAAAPPAAAPPAVTAGAPPAASAADAAKLAEDLTWTVQHVDSGKARLRIESKQEGTLLARQAGEVLYAGAISPGAPVVLDRAISADPVEVEFAPGGAVAGGVRPRAAVTALRSEAVLSRPPAPVRLRIDLRQTKNP